LGIVIGAEVQMPSNATNGWQFRYSWLWTLLREVTFLRSGLYLIIELWRTFRESQTTAPEIFDSIFSAQKDPWMYETNPLENARFLEETAMLDRVREGRLFPSGLEIGCAEGLYTEVLAARCASLLALDFSPTALLRAQNRRQWSERVRFGAFDMRHEPIPGSGNYDLIVLTGVLEYFPRSKTLFKIREKVVAALRVSGYLLVETTRANPVVEDSWWGRRLIRGRWINVFITNHPSLAVVQSTTKESYCITLCQKIASGNIQCKFQ
jgi:SAM-dependent methyltransferase